MAKWSSTILEILHEVGRDSPLGRALVSLVENGKHDLQVGGISSGVDADARNKLMRKLEHLEALSLVALAGGMDQIADSSREAYLAACHEIVCDCNQLAGEAFGLR